MHVKISITMSDTAIAKELFERLEAYRKSRGISQETLVENLGISRPTYARLQNGACSLATFIAVLREMRLLEGLDVLVPTLEVRPSDVFRAQKRHSRRVSGISASKENPVMNRVGAMLALRRKEK
ncbi:helix-turn-helix domain-containing protein [Pantoea ananatis]|uniref:helix-turn-helix domain-containing protein n=1 Tax=Pantoea ananas TaxID=553 RepID=UPI001EF9EFC7|nr:MULTISPECIES: helix-turn-helix transcriptional regulator [Enterobacterales]